MTQEEIQAAYALAARPFIEAPGPTPGEKLYTRSWRYVLEVNSMCNLKCILCACGNRKGYDYTPGIMSMELLRAVLDKAAAESPGAVVCCYANSDPLLHPKLDQVVAEIRRRGFRCELSTNLHFADRIEGAISQQPDLFTVSVSGFTQPVYERHHAGGDIEKVKANLKILAKLRSEKYPGVCVGVSYHMYEDNLHELAPMREFVESLGFQFLISWARSIILEPTIQALRELDRQAGKDVPPYQLHPATGQDLNKILPPADPVFMKNLELLRVHPKKAQQLYARWPVSPVCIIADVFTYVRHDGRVQLCPWTDDMRMTLGNYLEMTPQQISEARRGHPFCQECLKYRTNLYFHIVDCTKWDGGGNV